MKRQNPQVSSSTSSQRIAERRAWLFELFGLVAVLLVLYELSFPLESLAYAPHVATSPTAWLYQHAFVWFGKLALAGWSILWIGRQQWPTLTLFCATLGLWCTYWALNHEVVALGFSLLDARTLWLSAVALLLFATPLSLVSSGGE